MIPLKRGDVVRNKFGRRFVVAYIKRLDDKEDRIKLYSPDHKIILTGYYIEKDIREGVLTPTGETVDLGDCVDGG